MKLDNLPDSLIDQFLSWQPQCPKPPLIIGLSGPQGCGKSTTTQRWVQMLNKMNHPSITLSIDDFYLSREAQKNLGIKYSANPYWQSRGYPGTHDVPLLLSTLSKLKNLPCGKQMLVPSYDKSAHDGLGDTKPPSQWPTIKGPLEYIFLEGWMLGFKPVSPQTIHSYCDSSAIKASHLEGLKLINQALNHYQAVSQKLNGLVHLIATDVNHIVNWRVQAEQKMKEQKGSGMTPDQVQAYIKTFLPAYELYVPTLISSPPLTPWIQVRLDAARRWEAFSQSS